MAHPSPLPDLGEPYSSGSAGRELYHAARFEGGAIGYGATLSPGAGALRTLLDEPEAPSALHELLDHGSPAGQLYALAGLAVTDRPAFEAGVKERTPARWARVLPRQSVETVFGCIQRKAYFDDLVMQIGPGLAQEVTGRVMKVRTTRR